MKNTNQFTSAPPRFTVGVSHPSANRDTPARRLVGPALAACFAICIADAARADEPFLVIEESRNANTVIGLEVTATEDDSAVAVDLNHIIRLDDRTILVAELSGAKGEEEFGILSAGIALRHLLDDSQTFVGVNVFYDALRDSDGFSYSQLGFGAEISRGKFTLRGNYYLPIGDHADTFTSRGTRHEDTIRTGVDRDGRSFTAFGHRTFTDTFELRRDAMQSWEVELEMAFFDEPRFIEPVVAVGYYRTWDDGADYSGLMARGEVHIGEHITAGVEWRQDAGDIGQEWRAGIRFEFPIGREPKPVMAARLPAVAAGDGKTIRPLEYSDGKSIRPLDGGGKAPRPPEPATRPPRNFFDPVRRTPWPQSVVRTRVQTSNPLLATPFILLGPAIHPDDCGCESGPILIFP